MILKPFFSYFGSKYFLAKHYPRPQHDILIEPFAGSACYSLHYPHKQVRLVDKYDVICSIWDYLIKVSDKEILGLPLLAEGETLDDYPDLCSEAKNLIGFWLAKARTVPTSKMSSYSAERFDLDRADSWNPATKRRIARQVGHIRHWTIKQDSYENIDNESATWFIDPPYETEGKSYKESSKNIDYTHLGEWCKNREGQVIVCETNKAKWLEFEPLKVILNSGRGRTEEVVWLNDNNIRQRTLF